MKIKFILLFCLLCLSSCNALSQSTPIPPTATSLPSAIITHFPTPSEPTPTPRDPQAEVLARAAEVVQLLKNQDMVTLATYVHRNRGLRFSPYATIQTSDLIFTASQVPGLMDDPTIYHWGISAGAGDALDMTFAEYYAEFIYDVDFASAPEIAVDQRLGPGSTIDNSGEYYEDNSIVDYYFPGFDPSYQGMDWRSLRLAFKYCQGDWMLTGLIHDEWTP